MSHGSTYAIMAKADRTAHAAYMGESAHNGKRQNFCLTKGLRPLGRTEVGTVDGYQGILDAEQTFPGIKMCPDCLHMAQGIVDDHNAEVARVQAEGAAAGRKIRYTLVIEEDVSEAATLFSIEDARKRFEQRVRFDLVKQYGAESLPEGYTVSVEFADDQR